jgi:tRNA modification GTPase
MVYSCSVKEADISLCVLSLPEVLSPLSTTATNQQIIIPPNVRDLITPNTYFLFNKSDLVPSTRGLPSAILDETSPSAGTNLIDLHGRAWTTSLTTGEGAHAFVQGLAGALKSRYVQPSPLWRSRWMSYQPTHPSFDIAAPNAAGQRQLHAPIITRARHRVQLEAAARFLQAFLDLRKPFLIGICASDFLLRLVLCALQRQRTSCSLRRSSGTRRRPSGG